MIIALLTILRHDGRMATLLLQAGTTTVGRAADNDLVLDDPQIAEYHLRITASPQEVLVTDLGSAAGTYLDGERLVANEPRSLHPGKTLILGSTELTLGHVARSGPSEEGLPADLHEEEPSPQTQGGLLSRMVERFQDAIRRMRGNEPSEPELTALPDAPPSVPSTTPPRHEGTSQVSNLEAAVAPAGDLVQNRRLDAAMPGVVAVGQPTRLLVQVRFRDSPPLGREDWPTDTKPDELEQGKSELQLTFAGGKPVPLLIRVATDTFDVREPERMIEVPPDGYSPLVTFRMVACVPGPALVDVEVYTQERRYLGAACIDAEISADEPADVPLRLGQISLRPVVLEPLPSVEIELEQAAVGLAATLTLFQPDGRTESVLAAEIPVAIDEQALLAATLDPIVYGEGLTRQLFADLRLQQAWAKARGFAALTGGDMRVRLRLDAGDALHELRWETLLDPESALPLALSERVLISRYLASADLNPIQLPSREQLRATLLVASPTDLESYNLAPLDVAGEVAAARLALGSIPTTLFAAHPEAAGRATLDGVRAGLREGAQILYLMAHGTLRDGEPYLWLERPDGASERVRGAELVAAIEQAARRPLLVVLASCQSAGGGIGSALLGLGPQLARVGVPAVIGFQGDVSVATARRFLRPLFAELTAEDGVIDRAMAVARASLRDSDWWQGVLWLRTRDGRLWADGAQVASGG